MRRASVLVFAGLDPSGGAGIQADIEAIGALGAHALPIVTTLTVQDNDRVFAVHPVAASVLREQAQALMAKIDIAAIKIGIVGNSDNAQVIAAVITALRAQQPELPVVLDPVLASGQGDALSRENAIHILAPLRRLATLITPNLPEAAALCGGQAAPQTHAAQLLQDAPHVLIKGAHAQGEQIHNHWFSRTLQRSWQWPRLPGEFHGSGCTLASAIAALLAQGQPMDEAIERAQIFCQRTLDDAYVIAAGQQIPARHRRAA